MFDVDELAEQLGTRKTVIGVSGGVDSMLLMYIISQNLNKFRCDISVVTVNHRLNANSDAWAVFTQHQCDRMGLHSNAVSVVTVDTDKNLENSARAARYHAFRGFNPEAIVLAHHADDQAETVLMKLFRGAGARGLKGMKKYGPAWFDPTVLMCRPMLDCSRAEIETYAKLCEVPYITDPSNADTKYDRNWLRNTVIPEIRARNPQAVANISKTASILGESLELMRDLANIDQAAATRADGTLDWPTLCSLSNTRLKNLLMHVLEQNGVHGYSTDHIEEFSNGLLHANSDNRNEMRIGSFKMHKLGHRVILTQCA